MRCRCRPTLKPAAGADKHLVVWQPSTRPAVGVLAPGTAPPAGWQARAGWRHPERLVQLGQPTAPKPGLAPRPGWGASSATSLSIAGGLITLEDLKTGQINHALAMAIPNPRGEVYAAPAHRTDGWSTELTSLPEGAHLRLEPGLDLAALHLPKMTLMLAEAAQRYGIFIRDSSVNVALYGQDPTPTGTNPYAGAHGYYEGKSAQQILEAFPWNHLQLLKVELHGAS